jgi:acyl-CoA thioester hydrolase
MCGKTETAMKPDAFRLDPAAYPHWISITTRFGDMDINHHLNNVAYARYFEEARVTFNHGLLMEGRHRVEALKQHRIMVAAVSISYLREGHYGGAVDVGIGVSRIGNTSFAIGAAAFQSGACLAVHDATIALKDPAGNGIPDIVRARLQQNMLKQPT